MQDNKIVNGRTTHAEAVAQSTRLKRDSFKAQVAVGRDQQEPELPVWPPKGKLPSKLSKIQVTQLEFPLHIVNALNSIDVHTIRDLIATPETSLVRILGKRRFKDIQDKLKEFGVVV